MSLKGFITLRMNSLSALMLLAGHNSELPPSRPGFEDPCSKGSSSHHMEQIIMLVHDGLLDNKWYLPIKRRVFQHVADSVVKRGVL